MDEPIKNKIYKVFQLIRLLDPLAPKSVQQLERILEISDKTVYRHIKMLEDLGYPIETDDQNRKYIKFVTSSKNPNANIINSHELEEIQGLLQLHKSTHPIVEGILQKLNYNSSLIPLADSLPGLHKNRLLQQIRIAIDLQVCIKIIGYRSLTSNSISNREVEPLEVTDDYRYLIAWDKGKNDQRQFKLDRIEDIEVLDDKISQQHEASPMDFFGLTGEEWLNVKLELSDMANHFLSEEFPLCRQYVRKTKDKFVFDGRVRNWKGIGRFVLGLPGEVRIIAPQAFKDYIQEKIQKF